LAYALLAGEDYILGRTASGTVVNPRLRHLLTPGGRQELRRKFTVLPHRGQSAASHDVFQPLDIGGEKGSDRIACDLIRTFQLVGRGTLSGEHWSGLWVIPWDKGIGAVKSTKNQTPGIS
jgi:hypothetical protein